jgi:hypothetical protein
VERKREDRKEREPSPHAAAGRAFDETHNGNSGGVINLELCSRPERAPRAPELSWLRLLPEMERSSRVRSQGVICRCACFWVLASIVVRAEGFVSMLLIVAIGVLSTAKREL